MLDPRLDALVEPLKQDLDAGGWPADHDLLEAQGLRHLGLRLASATGDVLITLISSHAQLRGLEDLAQSWVERWPEVKGVCLNLQPKANNLVLVHHIASPVFPPRNISRNQPLSSTP